MISSVILSDINETILPEFNEELEKIKGKTILITGANGLIASYLVDTMNQFNQNKGGSNPCKLFLLSRNPITEKSRLSHLLTDSSVEFITHDIGHPIDLPAGINIIFHAASRANHKSFQEDPLDTIDANVNGMRNLLDYARKNPVDHFLFFSSGEIYGNPLKDFIPTPETYTGNIDPLAPSACYTESKRFCETLGQTFFRNYGVPVKNLRILLSYGPGIRDDGKVISDFFKASVEKRSINIRDRGDAQRSFMYVADTARAIFRVMFSGEPGQAYNIADDTNNVSIKGLAELIAKTVDNGTIVSTNPLAEKKDFYGIDTRYLDITKLRNLGFSPQVCLEEGLTRLYSHLKENK